MDRLAADSSVEGLLVLVAAGGGPDPNEIGALAASSDVPVVGGIFPQIIHEGVVYEAGVVVGGLPTSPTVSTVTGLADEEEPLRPQLDSTPLSAGDRTAFVFIDAYAPRCEELVNALFDTYGVEFNFIGGGAGGLDSDDLPSIITPDGVRSDSAVLATLPTDSSIGVHHGWQEIDGPYRVTGSAGRRIDKLDGKPAVDVYSDAVERHSDRTVDPDEFFETAKHHPFALSRMGRENIVRDPYAVTAEGGLECFGTVPEGEFVHVLAGDTEALVDAARAAYDDASDKAPDGDPGPVLSFDCISRALFMGSSFSTELDAVGEEGEPVVGALTIGEIANDGHGHLEFYNKTAVVAQLHD